MSISDSSLFNSIIGSRLETALQKVKGNHRYIEYCLEQEEGENEFEEILIRLDDGDRKAIERQEERNIAKVSYELEEVYFQGLRDGVSVLAFLGLFDATERL